VLSNALLKWAGPGAAVFFIVPAVLMSLHLHATDELTEAEKQRWRKVSRWGGGGVSASLFLSHPEGSTSFGHEPLMIPTSHLVVGVLHNDALQLPAPRGGRYRAGFAAAACALAHRRRS